MKNILIILFVSFLGLKLSAQTTHTVSFVKDTCLFKVFNIAYSIDSGSAWNGTYAPLTTMQLSVPSGHYLRLNFVYKSPIDLEKNRLNGVSVLDLIIGRNLILSGNAQSFIPLVVAHGDINGNGGLSTLDLVLIRRHIQNNPDVHRLPNNPWLIFSENKQALMIDNKGSFLITKDEALEFYPIKVGDLSGDANYEINGFGCLKK